jgi:hypothetical protein
MWIAEPPERMHHLGYNAAKEGCPVLLLDAFCNVEYKLLSFPLT